MKQIQIIIYDFEMYVSLVCLYHIYLQNNTFNSYPIYFYTEMDSALLSNINDKCPRNICTLDDDQSFGH